MRDQLKLVARTIRFMAENPVFATEDGLRACAVEIDAIADTQPTNPKRPCVGCGGRGGWYSPDDGTYVTCVSCAEEDAKTS